MISLFHPDQLALPVTWMMLLPTWLLLWFFILFTAGNRFSVRVRSLLAIGTSGLALVVWVLILILHFGEQSHLYIPWLYWKQTWWFIGFKADGISTLFFTVILCITFLVQCYSYRYMKDRRNQSKYYPYIHFFAASMLLLVSFDNLLMMFMAWELVGFASFLLIGFWYEKERTGPAASKAFLMNRLSDAGFIVALVVVYSLCGSFQLSVILETQRLQEETFSLIWSVAGAGLCLAAIGKSAQFPFMTWLPDAMEGPTPVSALLHAATMVTAGVFLLLRIEPMLGENLHLILLYVGSITAFVAALPALFTYDAKKVLAWSTVSQLGFMMAAIGAGFPGAAFFHLITHAFFKAGLFLSVGSVIHALHHLQLSNFKLKPSIPLWDTLDMRLMGGLRIKLPFTHIAYLACAAALVGLPLTGGFMSKESILSALLEAASKNDFWYWLPFILLLLTSGLTAGYIFRQYRLIFLDSSRLHKAAVESSPTFEVHEGHWSMRWQSLVLGLASIWLFYDWNPIGSGWIVDFAGFEEISHAPSFLPLLVMLLVLLGGAAAYLLGRPIKGIFSFKEEPLILKSHYGLHSLYLTTGIGLRSLSRLSLGVENLIHQFVHYGARSIGVLAFITAWLDRALIDGIWHWPGYVLWSVGKWMITTTAKHSRSVLLFSLVILLLILWYLTL
jgi:NADH-quinone oxidoreductase subunit L